MSKYRFEPEPEIQGNAILPASRLAVYASRAVPGAVSVTMSREGVVEAGARLSHKQVGELILALTELIGQSDESATTTAFDLGYAEGFKDGERNGFNAGWDDGHSEGYSEGWEEGYALGFERGEDGAA